MKPEKDKSEYSDRLQASAVTGGLDLCLWCGYVPAFLMRYLFFNRTAVCAVFVLVNFTFQFIPVCICRKQVHTENWPKNKRFDYGRKESIHPFRAGTEGC